MLLNTKLQREKESSLHNLVFHTIVLKDREQILSFQLLLMESETVHILKKLYCLQLFYIQFFLFAGAGVKRNDSEVNFCKLFQN